MVISFTNQLKFPREMCFKEDNVAFYSLSVLGLVGPQELAELFPFLLGWCVSEINNVKIPALEQHYFDDPL